MAPPYTARHKIEMLIDSCWHEQLGSHATREPLDGCEMLINLELRARPLDARAIHSGRASASGDVDCACASRRELPWS